MNKEDYLADEILIIKESGEMPEVAYHSALYFLCRDEEGPQIKLNDQDLLPLKKAICHRYRTIIKRDLTPDNRDKSIYRGMARAICNWQRLKLFCNNENFDYAGIKEEIAGEVTGFLAQEEADMADGRQSSINCHGEDLCLFLEEMGLGKLKDKWSSFNPDQA